MIYIFQRFHGGQPVFYPVQLPNDKEAIANAEFNSGTLKVTTQDGRVVWSLQ